MPVNTLHASFFQRFNQLLLMQPTTNAKWSLNRRDNNSLTTLEDADSTQFYWWLDKSGGKGSSLDFKTFRCSTPSSVGSHERKSNYFSFHGYRLTMVLNTETSWSPNYYLYHRICLTINKIVYYQHLLVLLKNCCPCDWVIISQKCFYSSFFCPRKDALLPRQDWKLCTAELTDGLFAPQWDPGKGIPLL